MPAGFPSGGVVLCLAIYNSGKAVRNRLRGDYSMKQKNGFDEVLSGAFRRMHLYT